MPRYRFSWLNLPPPLLKQLGVTLDIKGAEVPEKLRSKYGARPTTDFVQELWPTLRDRWLANDRESRTAVIEQLKAGRLGAADTPVRSAAEQLEYLKSCKNQQSLREVVLGQFLSIGEVTAGPAVAEQSGALAAAVSAAPASATAPISSADSPQRAAPGSAQPQAAEPPPQTLQAFVESALKHVLASPQIERTAEGDIPIQRGSAWTFVRVIEQSDDLRIHFYSPLLRDVKTTPELLETLNTINLGLNFGKLMHTPADEVFVGADLPGVGVTTDQILWAMNFITGVADYFDTELSKLFGATKWFEGHAEAVDV